MQLIPNGAERIFELTVTEQQHRQRCESEALMASIADTRRGQILGGIIASLAIRAYFNAARAASSNASCRIRTA